MFGGSQTSALPYQPLHPFFCEQHIMCCLRHWQVPCLGSCARCSPQLRCSATAVAAAAQTHAAQHAQGNAFYQATFLLEAGVDVDIYTGSDNIVAGINSRPNLCQTANPPAFCSAAPFAAAMVCTVNEYDPRAVYRCPNAAASAQVSFGLAIPACDCAALPDNPTYQRNVAVWVTNMMVQNALSAAISVPEGKCIQQDAVSARSAAVCNW